MAVPPNLLAGWSLVLAGFLSGALLGAGFHRAGFLGGYGSFRRRLLRLGHVACVALGMLNLLFVATRDAAGAAAGAPAGWLLIGGGIAMPLVCGLAAWRERLRLLFVVPVAALVGAAALVAFRLLPAGAAS